MRTNKKKENTPTVPLSLSGYASHPFLPTNPDPSPKANTLRLPLYPSPSPSSQPAIKMYFDSTAEMSDLKYAADKAEKERKKQRKKERKQLRIKQKKQKALKGKASLETHRKGTSLRSGTADLGEM